MHLTKRWGGKIILVGLLIPSGCHSSQSPEPPTDMTIRVGDGTVSLLRWKEGPAIMICSDVAGGWSRGGGTTAGPPWGLRVEFIATAEDGRLYDWNLETMD